MNSLQRTGLLLKRDAVEIYRPGLIAAAAVAGIVLIGYVLTAVFGDISVTKGISGAREASITHTVLFAQILFIGGAIITSRAFHEAHNNVKNHEWFMLPASTEEKFLSRLLLTTVGYSLLVIVGYFLATAISAGVTLILKGGHLGVFNPFNRRVLLIVLNYWVLQSVFLLGAAFFRKHHFVRTSLTLIVSGIVLVIFAAIVVRLVFSPYFDGAEPSEELRRMFADFDASPVWFSRFEHAGRVLSVVAQVLYWALFAPTCWAIAYFKLRETEVSDGV